jgi:hypothetical protein
MSCSVAARSTATFDLGLDAPARWSFLHPNASAPITAIATMPMTATAMRSAERATRPNFVLVGAGLLDAVLVIVRSRGSERVDSKTFR